MALWAGAGSIALMVDERATHVLPKLVLFLCTDLCNRFKPLNRSIHSLSDHNYVAPPSLFTRSWYLCDLFSFLRMKKNIKGEHFAEVEEVNAKMTTKRKGITPKEFFECFEQ